MEAPVAGLVPRMLLLVVCLVVAAFLVVGLRAARAEDKAQSIAAPDLSKRDFALARRAFQDAQELNPDTAPAVSEAALLATDERNREAVAVLDRVVRDEPENADAWTIMYSATRVEDPARAGRARARLRLLKPPVRR